MKKFFTLKSHNPQSVKTFLNWKEKLKYVEQTISVSTCRLIHKPGPTETHKFMAEFVSAVKCRVSKIECCPFIYKLWVWFNLWIKNLMHLNDDLPNLQFHHLPPPRCRGGQKTKWMEEIKPNLQEIMFKNTSAEIPLLVEKLRTEPVVITTQKATNM